MGTVFPYKQSFIKGGVRAVAHYLAEAICKDTKINLSIVSCTEEVNENIVEHRNGYTIYWIATDPRFSTIKAATIDLLKVRNLYDQLMPDIIHAQGFGVYALAANPSHHKLLLSVHGVEPFVKTVEKTTHFQGLVGLQRQVLGKRNGIRSIINSKAIISNSGKYVPQLLGKYIGDKPVYYIGNPISNNFFSLNSAEKKQRILLWAGTFSERKNVLTLLEVFKNVVDQFSDLQLYLVGPIAETWYFNKFIEQVINLELEGRVKHFGYLHQNELLKLYQEAKIFCLPSLEETAPMALAQAMAAGLPTVSSDVGGIPWMVTSGKTGFFTAANDVVGMTNYIKTLLQKDDLAKSMGSEARVRARILFSPTKVSDQTIKIYQDLLE